MVGAVTVGTMPVPVPGRLAGQQPIERGDQVGIGARPGLDDHQPRRGVRHEDGQQPITGIDVGEEVFAGAGQIGQAARRAGPDRQLAGVYGKMLRSASRRRPRPPRAGADS